MQEVKLQYSDMALILKQLWISIVILLLLQGNLCCREDEKIALLNLKSHFNYPNGEALASYGKTQDCCFWEDIGCDPTSGRVISIWLDSKRDDKLGNWYLNASLFLPFKELTYLYLYGNNIMGCVQNEGFERLSNVINLEYLELSNNQFNNSILSSLKSLSSLNYLALGYNKFKSTLNIQELSNLTSLEHLDLQGNEIEGLVFSHGLSNLKFLDMSHNHINVLSYLEGFASVRYLNLGYNFLKETLHIKEFEALGNLQELDLSGNQIMKFQSFTGLSKLSKLTLDNMITNGRSYSLLLQSLGVFPHLKTLSFKENNLKGDTFTREWHNMSNLEVLILDGCSLSENFLQNLGALQRLKFLSLCLLKDNLPIQGMPNFKHLEILHLNGSTTSKDILQVIVKMTSLKTLSLRGCGLNDTFPVAIGMHDLSENEAFGA